jgi:hypothetical protein
MGKDIYPLVINHSYGNGPIEIEGFRVKNGDFV